MTDTSTRSFITAFLRQPLVIGAILPSSRALVRAMVAVSTLQQARVVVELGGGTGALTATILAHLPAQAHYIIFETNPAFCELLRQRFPDPRVIVVERSAADLASVLRTLGHTHADCIFSGLPFQAFPRALTDAILHATTASMHAQSCFVAFQYTNRQEPTFRTHFTHVTLARRVWRNIPPARIYVGQMGHGATNGGRA